MPKQKLVIICGPTASGKTALAVDVAQHFSGEVISADSMQIYKNMDIGTAKPTPDEMRGVLHHMVDCAEIGEDYSVAVYRDHARKFIAEVASRGKLPILCGGTGLFISATVYPLDFSDASGDAAFRTEMEEYARQNGNEALHRQLVEANPAAAKQIHPNNVRRVIRALERARTTNPADESDRLQLFNGEPLYDAAWIGLTMDRERLYVNINARVDAMMDQGLLDEAKQLSLLHGRNAIAFQGLGYKELFSFMDGSATLDQAVEQIKTGTRNYAKRQLTWFRREECIHWFNVSQYSSRDTLNDDVYGYINSTLHIS